MQPTNPTQPPAPAPAAVPVAPAAPAFVQPKITEQYIPATLAGKNFLAFRRTLSPPLAIVVHVTDAPTAEGTIAWFSGLAVNKDPKTGVLGPSGVSAHYLVDKLGANIWALVREQHTAFHAGITWGEIQVLRRAHPDWAWLKMATNPNDVTIGIEHVGVGTVPWDAGQFQASVNLIASLCGKYKIPVDRKHIVGHHEIYAGHVCPGASCDLDHLVSCVAAAKVPPAK